MTYAIKRITHKFRSFDKTILAEAALILILTVSMTLFLFILAGPLYMPEGAILTGHM